MYGGGYSLIDNPAGGAQVSSGIAYNNTSSLPVGDQNTLTLTIGSGFPAAGIRVGILTDTTSTPTPTDVTLTQTAGSGTPTATLSDPSSTDVQEPNWYFFDITGASSSTGDVFTIALGNRTNTSKPTVGGITVDNLPEPSCLGLVAASGLLTLRRRRR
jgi:hypothetical protein